MSDPTTRLGRLSLENMATNPSRAQEAPRQAFAQEPYPHRGEDQASSSSEQEEDEEEENDEDDDEDDDEQSDIEMSTDSGEGADGPRLIRSPSRLLYDLQKLPRRDRALVRDAFDDPPRLALQRCRRMDNYYAFQMTELVTRSVRIYAGGHDDDESRTPSSSSAPRLSCSCHPEKKKSSGSKGRRGEQEEGEEEEDDEEEEEETGEGQTTCPHLLWLLDQILHQTLYGRACHEPVTMAPGASHAQEMGDPFAAIAEHHLDVLAAGLHCPVVDPESDAHGDDENDDSQREEELDATRVLEARELLAAVYDAPDPDRFRPDIFDRGRGTPVAGTKVVKRRDLDRTVLRMLLDNHHFFNYFLAQARPSDPVRDPFRKLAQRADHVLRLLHRHHHHHQQQHHDRAPTGTSSGATGRRPDRRSAEAPHDTDAAWASRHILGAVRTVESSIFSRQRPLSRQEALSAARTLVHILDIVVPSSPPPPPMTTATQRSSSSSHAGRETADLYNMLIGNSNNKDFVIGVLGLLPEAASQFVHSLETVLDRIGVHGAPATYVERFRALLRRLRASGSGHGVKRPKRGQSTDQLVKKMK